MHSALSRLVAVLCLAIPMVPAYGGGIKIDAYSLPPEIKTIENEYVGIAIHRSNGSTNQKPNAYDIIPRDSNGNPLPTIAELVKKGLMQPGQDKPSIPGSVAIFYAETEKRVYVYGNQFNLTIPNAADIPEDAKKNFSDNGLSRQALNLEFFRPNSRDKNSAAFKTQEIKDLVLDDASSLSISIVVPYADAVAMPVPPERIIYIPYYIYVPLAPYCAEPCGLLRRCR